MIEIASPYRPPWWLSSPHVQSMLGSSPMRIRRGARALAALGARAETVVLDAGEGVRLQGVFNALREGEPRGLARSTVLTMMERLRAKAYLRRRQVDGVYRYAAVAQSDDVMRSAVGSFVEKTLQGSLSPFVAWMSQRTEVSDDELAELEALVANLQSKRKEG